MGESCVVWKKSPPRSFPKGPHPHTVPPTRRGSQPRGTVPSRQHTESPSGYSAWAWGVKGSVCRPPSSLQALGGSNPFLVW